MVEQPQPPQIDRDTFLAFIHESNLISPERLARALRNIPETDRARILARALVERKLLTRYQAERLLLGVTDGFFLGQYKILDRLGSGGMGKVYKAEHMTMSRVVALKVLSPRLTQTERARVFFQREVKAAARLSHPNIVTAFDANQIADRWFLVMEFVDGPDLLGLIKKQGPLPVSQACDYIRQTAVGLHYAAELGMVHRDIKPANLLVQKNTSKAIVGDYVIKILDFGLARLSGGAEVDHTDSIQVNTNSVMGTPDFMAPEQARNVHDVDGRTDLYALGCTFYYILTGKVPFPGGTAVEKLIRHGTAPRPSVRALRPDVPQEIDEIVRAMMAIRMEDRFNDGNEVALVLGSWTGHEEGLWVDVEPVGSDSNLPMQSGINLRPSPPKNSDQRTVDPWSDLDDFTPTDTLIQGQETRTESFRPPSTFRGRKPSSPRKVGTNPWMFVIPILATLVIVACVLTVAMFVRGRG